MILNGIRIVRRGDASRLTKRYGGRNVSRSALFDRNVLAWRSIADTDDEVLDLFCLVLTETRAESEVAEMRRELKQLLKIFPRSAG